MPSDGVADEDACTADGSSKREVVQLPRDTCLARITRRMAIRTR